MGCWLTANTHFVHRMFYALYVQVAWVRRPTEARAGSATPRRRDRQSTTKAVRFMLGEENARVLEALGALETIVDQVGSSSSGLSIVNAAHTTCATINDEEGEYNTLD